MDGRLDGLPHAVFMRKFLPFVIVGVVLAALVLWFFLDHRSPASMADGVPPQTEASGTTEPAALQVPEAQTSREAEPGIAVPPAVEPSGSKSPKGSVRGRFVNDLNAPVTGVEVSRIFQRVNLQALATSGDDGRFHFEVEGFTRWGKLGLYLTGKKRLYVPCRIDIVALKGEELDLGDLMLKAGGSVSGQVIDTDGLRIEDARVACTDTGLFDRDLAPRVGPTRPVIAETKSDASGGFLLEGAPPGEVRMWAGKQGLRYAFNEPIEVRAGEEISGVVIVLEPRNSADDWEIQVLEPGGSPCPGANIDFDWDCGAAGAGGANYTADDQGHLTVIALPNPCKYTFLASDPKGRFGPASVKDVRPGSGPVVLQLVERVPLLLRVVDEGGAAVERFLVRVVEPQRIGRDVGARIEEEQHPGGMIELSAPAVSFLVMVDASGFELARVGPFEPQAVPKEVEAKLVRLAGISGNVTGGGKRIEGAKVELREALKKFMFLNDFPTRCQYYASSKCESDAKGEFRLTLRQAGQYFVRAEKEGWALAELGPLNLDPAIGARDLKLELTTGGAIEGQLLLPAGQNPSGSVLAISRGDGNARTQRVGSGGAFRFEHLTPGRWLVKRLESAPLLGATSLGSELPDETLEIPWNCKVFEGETTRFDIDLSVERRAKLVGRLLLAGQPAVRWLVSLQSADSHLSAISAETGMQGDFELFAPEPGSYFLRAHAAKLGAASPLVLVDSLELALGEQTWNRDLPDFGRVEGRRASGPGPSLWLQWLGPGGLQASLEFTIDDQGLFTLPRVPSGPCKIQIWTKTGKQDLAAFEVRANETTRVELP